MLHSKKHPQGKNTGDANQGPAREGTIQRHLISIQPPPQIPRPPHQLLVLVLLHLQLPLTLDANRPQSGILLSSTIQVLIIAFLSNVHAVAETRGEGAGLADRAGG